MFLLQSTIRNIIKLKLIQLLLPIYYHWKFYNNVNISRDGAGYVASKPVVGLFYPNEYWFYLMLSQVVIHHMLHTSPRVKEECFSQTCSCLSLSLLLGLESCQHHFEMAQQLQLANFWGKKRKNASMIWDHFGFVTDDKGVIVNKEKVTCRHCHAELKYQGGSTSNLQYHYNSLHLKDTHPATPNVQPSIAQSFGQYKAYSSSSSRHNLLQKRVADFLIENLLPLSTVSSPSFVNLVKTLDPKFTVGSRKTYSDVVIPKMYADMRHVVDGMLRPIDAVACTTDGWTSIVTQSYITLSCHFIDKDWNMRSMCLQTRHHPESHTAENIKDMLIEAFHEWKIDQKCITGVVDNARNMVNAWQLMEKQHMLCFGHTLNLSVKKGLAVPGLGEVLSRCRKLVSHFNHSSVAKQALKSKQLQLGIKSASLKQDVDTRWNSTFDMVESVINNDEAVSGVLRADTKYNSLLLSPQDIATLTCVQSALMPWKKLTVLMSADKYPTLSLVAPSIQQLLNRLRQENPSDSNIIQAMKRAMASDLATRYQQDDIKMLLLCAAFLDPRIRHLDFITCSDEGKSNEEKKQVVDTEKKRVKDEIKRRMVLLDAKPRPCVVKSEVCEGSHNDSPPLPSCSAPAVGLSPSKKPKPDPNYFDDFFSDIMITKVEPATTPMTRAKKELKLYLTLPVENSPNSSFNQLAWWKKNEVQLPMMSRLAKSILTIPATSTPSERLFSKAGMLISKKRANLKPSKVDMMLFLNANNNV